MARRICVLAVLGVFSAALAACGAAANPAPPSPTAGRPGASPAASTPVTGGPGRNAASTSGDFSQSGLVLMQCLVSNPTVLKLTLLDPASGTVLAARSVSFRGYIPNVCEAVRFGTLRGQFDAGYDRVAVVIPTAGEGGSSGTHVGFVDLRTGQLTDITARRVKPGGFSTMSPHDGSPVFGPGNTFWFSSGGPTPQYYTADLVSGVSTEQPLASVPVALCWEGFSPCPDGLGNLSGHSGSVMNPSRTAIFVGNGNHLYLAPDWHDVAAALSCDHIALCSRVGISNCPQWYDDYRMFCDGGGGRLAVVTFSTNYRHATGRFVLPVNDRDNKLPVASPDRSSIAFVSSRYGGPPDWSIYRAPLAGGSEPTRVASVPLGDLGNPATLIEWK